jgi:chromate reductase
MSSIATSSPHSRLRVLAIAGSLRRDSYNRALLQAAASLAPPALSIDCFDGLADVPMFDEDLEAEGPARDPAGVIALRRRVSAADALLIATPEYNQSIPGVLKNAIDWLSRDRPEAVLAGKPVAILGATAGRWGTRLAQAALRHTLYATEAQVMPAPSVFLADAASLFDAGGALTDPRARAAIRALVEAFGFWIERCRQPV